MTTPPGNTEQAARAGSGSGWPRLQASEHRLLLLAGDSLVSLTAVTVALWTWSITAGFPFGFDFVVERASWFLAVPLWVLLLVSSRDVHVALSVTRTLQSLGRAAGFVLAGYLVVYFYAPREALPRLVVVYVLWEAVLLTAGWRLVYMFTFSRPALRRRVAVVGTSRGGEAIVRMLNQLSRHTVVVACVDPDQNPRSAAVNGVPVLGRPEQLEQLIARDGISEVVLAHDGQLSPDLMQWLVRVQEAGIDVLPMSTVYEQLVRRVPVAHLPPDWPFTMFAEAVRARDASRLLKRLIDVVGALVGVVALAVVTPLVAMLVWLDSGPPVFYRQTRTGMGGRVFRLVKFRTMVEGAEPDGPRWADPDDARVTTVGRWLRRSRLDELAQVLNVLQGDMSLVGPRPERPEFVAQLERQIPFYRIRLIVRPGLTGWAQINSIEDAALKLEYDLYYIKHRSMLFDLWIAWRTIGTVLRLRGH